MLQVKMSPGDKLLPGRAINWRRQHYVTSTKSWRRQNVDGDNSSPEHVAGRGGATNCRRAGRHLPPVWTSHYGGPWLI